MSRPQLLLVLGLLAIIAAVPLGQIAWDLYRREPVQATDVFRQAPTQANLRRYEKTLEDRSWTRQVVRPAAQQWLFAALKDTGSQALLGRDNWLFYRPGIRYLVEGDRPEPPQDTSIWVEPPGTATRRQSILQAIVRYRDQLKARGIELVVMPVPEKASVYPDMVTPRANWEEFRSPSELLLEDLRRAGVHAVDLFALFRGARRQAGDCPDFRGAKMGLSPFPAARSAYYLAHDTHWTPAGARLAAEAVAAEIRRLGLTPQSRRKYAAAPVEVRRSGDLIELMQIPGTAATFPSETVACRQIKDGIIGPMVPRPGDPDGLYANTHLKDTPFEPSLLVLGDSFCRIYQIAEPRSLGEVVETSPGQASSPGAKRLLPGSAGFPSLLAESLQSPVDYLISDGGAATDVRRRLTLQREILENKKILVWEFTERDLALGRQGWQDVELPAEL